MSRPANSPEGVWDALHVNPLAIPTHTKTMQRSAPLHRHPACLPLHVLFFFFFFFFFLFCFLALNATPTRSNALWLQSVQTAGSADNPSLAQIESTMPGLPANAPGRWAEITAPCAISPRPAPCASAALTASISVLAYASRHVAKVSNPSVMASMGVNALNARPSSLRKI